MSKDAYYFPHDSNARHDPKILRMRSTYKLEGLGLYWAIIEMMREQEGYLLPIEDGVIEAYALDLNCELSTLKNYINDCVSKYNLFQSDGSFIWSDSLIRRMSNFEIKSDQAREAANIRWNNVRNANALPTQSERTNDKNNDKKVDDVDTNNANALPTQSERNASKVKYSIVNNSKEDNIELPDFLDKTLWEDFMEMRKKKKIPNTPRAKNLLIKRLIEFNNQKLDANKSLENSIMRGWTGVFPPKEDNNKFVSLHNDGWR